MGAIGMILMLVGVLGFLATATGLNATVPLLASLSKIPPVAWAVAAVVGLVLWYFTRRPSD